MDILKPKKTDDKANCVDTVIKAVMALYAVGFLAIVGLLGLAGYALVVYLNKV